MDKVKPFSKEMLGDPIDGRRLEELGILPVGFTDFLNRKPEPTGVFEIVGFTDANPIEIVKDEPTTVSPDKETSLDLDGLQEAIELLKNRPNWETRDKLPSIDPKTLWEFPPDDPDMRFRRICLGERGQDGEPPEDKEDSFRYSIGVDKAKEGSESKSATFTSIYGKTVEIKEHRNHKDVDIDFIDEIDLEGATEAEFKVVEDTGDEQDSYRNSSRS